MNDAKKLFMAKYNERLEMQRDAIAKMAEANYNDYLIELRAIIEADRQVYGEVADTLRKKGKQVENPFEVEADPVVRKHSASRKTKEKKERAKKDPKESAKEKMIKGMMKMGISRSVAEEMANTKIVK